MEHCLARYDDPHGEGRRVYLHVDAERALAAADQHDRQRSAGAAVSPFAGIPISIKDLFDREGEVTRAGSRLRRDCAPATRDATAVARLIAAGFVTIGRTNMTEFAFSGLGLNPHYGTPANPFERSLRRIPGGSSSGAAVSVTDEMAFAALGTDTGGSCRIPAAMCGIVGFKPTARRVPLDGAFPLSPSLDSIGPLAASVDCCVILDAILAGEPNPPPEASPLSAVRFAVPQSVVFDAVEPSVAAAFERALSRLSAHGAQIVEIGLNELHDIGELNRRGGLAAPEAYAIHRESIVSHRDAYDPRVLARILRGTEQSNEDYENLNRARTAFIARIAQTMRSFDALLMPTVPMIAPTLASLTDDAAYTRANVLALRNPSIVNFIDGCAISIPCHHAGDAPVGLMIAALGGRDADVLRIARSVEQVLRGTPSGEHD